MTQGRRPDDGHNQISEAHASQEPYMSEFIVRVTCFELNYRGQVAGQIAEAFVPVEACLYVRNISTPSFKLYIA